MSLNQLKVRKGTLYLLPYIALISFFYFFFVDSYFKNEAGLNTLRIDADSYVYFALNEAYDNILLLFAINPNAIGPLFILRITNENLFLIFLINLTLFTWSYKVLISNYKLNSILFVILLVVNPLFIPAITTLNKEIFGVAAIAFYLSYCKSKNKLLLLLSLCFAIITRWQMVFILVFFQLFKLLIQNVRLNRWHGLILFILALSFTYPIFFSEITNVIDDKTAEQQQETAGAIITFFNTLQQKYLYFIALIPKAIFNLYGNVFRIFQTVIHPQTVDFNDIYNNVFLLGHQIVMIIASVIIVLKRRLQVNNDSIYFCFIYIIVFSLGPMIQYRYIFPLYIVFALIISESKFEIFHE